MNELHKQASTAAIRKYVVNYMAKLGILEKQIYSLTTDNKFNILKVGELIISGFVLPENFANQNDENKCDVTRDVEAVIFQTLPLPQTKNEKTTVDNFF